MLGQLNARHKDAASTDQDDLHPVDMQQPLSQDTIPYTDMDVAPAGATCEAVQPQQKCRDNESTKVLTTSPDEPMETEVKTKTRRRAEAFGGTKTRAAAMTAPKLDEVDAIFHSKPYHYTATDTPNL